MILVKIMNRIGAVFVFNIYLFVYIRVLAIFSINFVFN